MKNEIVVKLNARMKTLPITEEEGVVYPANCSEEDFPITASSVSGSTMVANSGRSSIRNFDIGQFRHHLAYLNGESA